MSKRPPLQRPPEKAGRNRILAMTATHGWWVGACIVVLGIVLYINVYQPITITNIHWDVPQHGICHVIFTVTNTSLTSIQAQLGIVVLKERKEAAPPGPEGSTATFYDEIGHKRIQVVLPSRQPQVLKETIEILPIFPVSKVTISIGRVSK